MSAEILFSLTPISSADRHGLQCQTEELEVHSLAAALPRGEQENPVVRLNCGKMKMRGANPQLAAMNSHHH